MARPPRADREKVADVTLTIRVTQHEKALLEALVARRNTEIGVDGGSVSLGGYVRTMIRREAKEKGVDVSPVEAPRRKKKPQR